METAAVIHIAGPHSLRFAWKTHYVGHLRAVNNNFLDTYQLKSQDALLDGNILKISQDGDGYLVTVSFIRTACARCSACSNRNTKAPSGRTSSSRQPQNR